MKIRSAVAVLGLLLNALHLRRFESERIPRFAESGVGELFDLAVCKRFPVGDENRIFALLLGVGENCEGVVVFALLQENPSVEQGGKHAVVLLECCAFFAEELVDRGIILFIKTDHFHADSLRFKEKAFRHDGVDVIEAFDDVREIAHI